VVVVVEQHSKAEMLATTLAKANLLQLPEVVRL
jgi:hypothetical protein